MYTHIQKEDAKIAYGKDVNRERNPTNIPKISSRVQKHFISKIIFFFFCCFVFLLISATYFKKLNNIHCYYCCCSLGKFS